MRNLRMFIPSCGHIEIAEGSDEDWERWTAAFTAHGPMNTMEGYRNPVRVGRKTRMVYVHPFRFTCCQACSEL